MKIGIISTMVFTSPSRGYAGLEEVAACIAQALDAKGHEVTLIAAVGSTGAFKERWTNSNVTVFECEQPSFSNPEQAAYEKYQRVLKDFDVVLDHTWQAWAYTYKKEHPETKIIHVLHGLRPWGNKPPVDKPCLCGVSKFHRDYIKTIYQTDAEYCLPPETMIATDEGEIPIEEIVKRKLSPSLQGIKYPNLIMGYQRFEPYTDYLLCIKTKKSTLRLTPDHLVLTLRGWIKAKDLRISDYVCTMRNRNESNSLDKRAKADITSKISRKRMGRVGGQTKTTYKEGNKVHGKTLKTKTVVRSSNQAKVHKNSEVKRARLGLLSWLSRWGRTLNYSKIFPPWNVDSCVGHSQFGSENSILSQGQSRNKILFGTTSNISQRCVDPSKASNLAVSYRWSENVAFSPKACSLSNSKERTSRTFNQILQNKIATTMGVINYRRRTSDRKANQRTQLSLERISSIEVDYNIDYVYDLTTTNSSFIANDIVVHNCYNGIDLELYPFQEEKQDYLVYLSRMSYYKGALQFIDLCRKAGVKGVLMGSDRYVEDPGFVMEVMRRCDGKQIKYMGEVSHDLKVHYLQNAKALVSPLLSEYSEVFGLNLIEANACGTPVIATNSGAVPEVIADTLSGFVTENVPEMLGCLGMLDSIDPKLCRVNAEDFSKENCAERYLELIKRVLDSDTW